MTRDSKTMTTSYDSDHCVSAGPACSHPEERGVSLLGVRVPGKLQFQGFSFFHLSETCGCLEHEDRGFVMGCTLQYMHRLGYDGRQFSVVVY